MAAVMRLRPDARKLWFSKVRSRISPWRWKNTARRSALLASPLLRPAWLRWRSAGSDSHCRVNSVRSAERAERPRQDVTDTRRRQLAQDDGRNDRAGLDRDLEPHEFRPLPEDRCCLNCVADQRHEQRPRAGLLDRIELAVLQI